MTGSPWVQDLVVRAEQWVPPEVARVAIALAVIALGYVLALVLRYAVTRLLSRASAHLASLTRRVSPGQESGAPAEPSTRAEAAAIDVAGRVVFWLVFTLFLGTGAAVLGLPVLSSWLEGLAAYLPRILAAAAIVLLGVLSGYFARAVITAGLRSSGFALAQSAGRAAQLAVVALAGAVAIEELGVGITVLIVIAAIVLGTTLGGAALAFGLGARTSVSNLLACHYLAKWYRPGQVVRIGELHGRIVEILPSAVVLQTEAGKAYIPAQEFADKPSLLVADRGEE